MGVNYGSNLRIYNNIYIKGYGDISIGDNFILTSGGGINTICRNVKGGFYVPNKTSVIRIGNNVGMSSTSIWARGEVTIGDNVNIGGDCLIMDNDAHPLDYRIRRKEYVEQKGVVSYYEHIKTSPVHIANDVWIGARCIILKGVNIGEKSIIAAGSVVVKDIPSRVLAGGNPCHVIRNLD